MAQHSLSSHDSFDPGLTQQYGGTLRRSINKDGSFNVHRTGTRWQDENLYSYVVRLPWPKFIGIVFLVYFAVNLMFAGLFWVIGVKYLQGADVSTPFRGFMSAFFFSTQTLTTVGYGIIGPVSLATNG
jgi:inward rectifier potassium channel